MFACNPRPVNVPLQPSPDHGALYAGYNYLDTAWSDILKKECEYAVLN